MNSLKSKNIIVTGASGGIGNSIVEKLYENGSNILATGTKVEKPNTHFSSWAILVGPEGGFSSKEQAFLNNHKQTFPISLGPRILRADTAVVAALTFWQNNFGDW